MPAPWAPLDHDLVSQLDVGVGLLDRRGRLRWANNCLVDLLGGAKDFEQVLDEQGLESFRGLLGPETAPRRARLRLPHGSMDRWVEAVVSPAGDASELICAVWDISLQVSVEELLVASESRYRSIVEVAADAVLVVDAHGRVLVANPAAVDMFGSSGLVGRRLDELLVGSGGNEALTSGRDHELSARRAGRMIPVEASVSRIEGDPASWVWLVRDTSERRAREKELAHRAGHDALTGLPNRVTLLAELDRDLAGVAAGLSNGVGVLYLDLDRFKAVNDRLGHDVGDQLLVAASSRIRSVMRAGDTLARMGGDEFVMVCRAVEQVEDLARVAERIVDTVARPFGLSGGEALIGTSIGVAVSGELRGWQGERPAEDCGGEVLTASQLVDRADAALLRAKGRGRGCWELYDAELARWSDERREIERALAGAIERDELSLVFQPVVDIASGAPRGAEALVRWDRPQGQLSPDIFIPVAEDCGLIAEVGMWVLGKASSQLASLATRGHRDLIMSVNLSARQLGEPGFAARAAARVRQAGIDPGQLQLEVTESVLIGDADEAMAVLEELNEQGFRLAMDDFGTGYSSMSYLHRFPLDAVKIDRSFVQPIGSGTADATIVSMIVALARALRLEVVAEGVESAAHASALEELGCDAGQGYHYSRPLDFEGLVAWLGCRSS